MYYRVALKNIPGEGNHEHRIWISCAIISAIQIGMAKKNHPLYFTGLLRYPFCLCSHVHTPLSILFTQGD
jgi:hypothetical protein